MIKFYNYLKAQLWRAVKLYPAILCFTLVLCFGLFMILYGLFYQNDNQESRQKIQIGIVGNTSDTYLGVGIEAIKNFDTSKYYIEFLTLDAKTAENKLKNNEIMGYLIIPDGFVNSIVNGENKQIIYMQNNSPEALGPVIMSEIATTISDIVTESQSGIYGFMYLADEAGLTATKIKKLTNTLNLQYIDTILNRETVCTFKYVGISSGLSFKDYYLCAFIVLIILLSGTVCPHLLIKKSLSLPMLLRSKGQGILSQVAAEYLPYFMILLTNIFAIILLSGTIFKDTASSIGLLQNLTVFSDYLLFGIKMIPVIAMISIMQFFLYMLCSNIISGVLLQTLSALILSFSSGLFYPLYSMPKIFTAVSKFLPSGIAFNYVKELLNNSLSLKTAFFAIFMFLLFFTLNIAVRHLKLRRAQFA